MSRIFDALREAERARGAAGLPQTLGAEFSGVAKPPCTLPAREVIENPTEAKEKALLLLERRLDLLATRLTASRANLEVLLAKAQRLERSWEENLDKVQGDSLGSRPDALPFGSEAHKAQLLYGLEISSRELVEQAQKRLEEKAASVIESLGKSAEAWLVALAAEFRETGARQLQADFQGTLEKQRVLMVERLEREADMLSEQAAARIQSRFEQAGRETFDALYQQVGRAVLTTKDWADHARVAFEADLKKSLEAFREQAVHISSSHMERHREYSEVLVAGLQSRLQRAAQILSEDWSASDAT